MNQAERKFVVCDSNLCTGCGICELACSAKKERVFNPLFSRIHAVRLESVAEPLVSMSVACQLCEDMPACVRACPHNALEVNKENGTIKVHREGYEFDCKHCGWCMVACEFGAAILDPEARLAIICDLCTDERPEPPCVKSCPYDALKLATIEEVQKECKSEAANKVLDEFSRSRKDSKTFFERLGYSTLPKRLQK